MADYIDRKELLKKAYVFDTQSNVQWVSVKDIKSMPSVDAVKQKHGHWVPQKNYEWIFNCSECGFENIGHDSRTKYCPHCGATMDEEELCATE